MTVKMMNAQHFQSAHLLGYHEHHHHFRQQQQQQQMQETSELISSTVPDVEELVAPLKQQQQQQQERKFNPMAEGQQLQNELAFRQIQISPPNSSQYQHNENYHPLGYTSTGHHYHNLDLSMATTYQQQQEQQQTWPIDQTSQFCAYRSIQTPPSDQSQVSPSAAFVTSSQRRNQTTGGAPSPRSSCSPSSSIVGTYSTSSTSSHLTSTSVPLQQPIRPTSNISSYANSEDVFLADVESPMVSKPTSRARKTKLSARQARQAASVKQHNSLEPLATGRVVVKRLRRVKANDRERNRMHNLNEALDRLRQHLPGGKEDNKMTKIETLKSAQEYIQQLARLLEETKDHPINSYTPPTSASSFASSSSGSSRISR